MGKKLYYIYLNGGINDILEKEKQIKLIIYYIKFKTSNLIVKNNTNSAKIHQN